MREARDRTTTFPRQDAQRQRRKRAKHLLERGQQPRLGVRPRQEPGESLRFLGKCGGGVGSHTSPWEAEAGKSQIRDQPGLYSEVLFKSKSPYLISKGSQERKDMQKVLEDTLTGQRENGL